MENLNASGKGKKFFKKAFQGFKTMNLAPLRIAVLTLFELNLWGMASSILAWKTKEPKKYNAIRDDWYKLGGNRTKFDKNIEKGGKKKPLRILMKKDIIKSFEGEEKLGVVADTAALITAGGGVLTAMVTSVKKQGGSVDTEADNLPAITPEEQAEMDETKKAVESGKLDPDKTYTVYWVIGGVVVALAIGGFIFWKVKKGKK